MLSRLLWMTCCTMLSWPTLGAAQEWPNRPIRIVMPYAAGGTGDLMVRALQDPLEKALGQQILIEHRPGAGGLLGARSVARAVPDGYTFLFGNNGPNAIGPQLNASAGYDPARDFAPVTLVSVVPLILSVSTEVPANDVQGLIAFARGQRKPLEYGTVGVGSFGFLATEVFAKAAGIDLLHVPYKSSGQVVLGLIGHEVKLAISAPSEMLFSNAKAGKLKILGVSSEGPTPLAPGVPVIRDVLPEFVLYGWFGLFAPAGTPTPIVERMSAAVRRVLDTPELNKRYTEYGFAATGTSPNEFNAYVQSEIQRWGKVIREGRYKTD